MDVDQIPDDIDGKVVYKIPNTTTDKKVVAALHDGRKWKKTCPTSWKDHARVRYADCKGSHKCTRKDCPFKVQYGVVNTTQFKNNRNGMTECKGCGNIAEFVPCLARRYVSYGGKSLTVYHYGHHTCPVIKRRSKNKDQVKQLLKDNPNIKPTELQSACIISAFRDKSDWRAVEKQAESTLDTEWISREKKQMKKDIEPVGHNFEAVVTFKEYCDQKDKFYIYKVNDKRGNPDKPSFVLKTSEQKARMALDMNREGNHFLNNEFCYFDGKYKRCRNFVTLTASVYHPLLRKQLTLAIMEAETEDTENITLFWTLFNEVLQKVSGNNNEQFNPIGWCTDMAGANLAGICNVFGESAKCRIKSCEFHFKDHRNKKANKLDPDSSNEFKTLCNELLESETEKQYDNAKGRMDLFISENDDRLFLKSWLSWWHDRRGFIFRAFTPNNAPSMNQAEVIHAGWAHKDPSNMSLLEVCQADVRDALILDVELKAYGAGTTTGGNGPSYSKRKRKQYEREINQAKQIGSEMFQNQGKDHSGRKIDPTSSFRPTEKKKRSRKSSSKSQNVRKDAAINASASGTSSLTDPQTATSASTLRENYVTSDTTSNITLTSNIQSLQSHRDQLQTPRVQTHQLPLPRLLAPQLQAPQIQKHRFEAPPNQSTQPPMVQSSRMHTPMLHLPPSQILQTSQTLNVGYPTASNMHFPRFQQPHMPFNQEIRTSTLSPTYIAFNQRTTHSIDQWHSGMSPFPYEVVLLPNNVRKCYGCGNDFADKYRKPPFNLIVKHMDRRVIRKCEQTGRLVFSHDFNNTYYHLVALHILRKNPTFAGVATISRELFSTLDDRQREILTECDINVGYR